MKNQKSLSTKTSYFVEERPIGFLITAAAASFEREFLKKLSEEEALSSITSADHAVLRSVALEESSSVEIARKLGVSKQAIGKTVNSLEERGFIVRKESESDRRKHILVMTNKGQKLVTKSIQAAKELENFTIDILGVKNLNLLKKLLGEIQAAQEDSID